MNAVAEAICWADWCDSEPSRYDICRPFVKLGVMYATDTLKAIRIPCPGEPDTPPHEDRKRPNVDEVFCEPSSEWQTPPPESAIVSAEGECPDCEGTGFSERKECLECAGAGEIECDSCGHVDLCEECDGDGMIGITKCVACGGRRKRMRQDYVMFGETRIQAKFYHQVMKLPNPMWSKAKGMEAIVVKFDGGEAMVMGLAW